MHLRAAVPVRNWMRLRAAMPGWKRPCKELIHEPTPRDRTMECGRPCCIFIIPDFAKKFQYQGATAMLRKLALILSFIGLASLVACMPPPSG